jgi:hypothetical protein
MADNLGYTPGSGATVATEETGGVHHQRVLMETLLGGVPADVSDENPMPVKDDGSRGLLLRILQMLMAPLGYDKSLQRQRGTVVVESGTVTTVTTVTTVSTVTTCAAVTSLNNLDGYNARMPVLDQNRTAWAQCVRARIT